MSLVLSNVLLEHLVQFIDNKNDFLNLILLCQKTKNHFCDKNNKIKREYLAQLLKLKVLLPTDIVGKDCVLNISTEAISNNVLNILKSACQVNNNIFAIDESNHITEMEKLEKTLEPTLLLFIGSVPGESGRHIKYYYSRSRFYRENKIKQDFLPHVTSIIISGYAASYPSVTGHLPNYFITDYSFCHGLDLSKYFSSETINKHTALNKHKILSDNYSNVVLVYSPSYLFQKVEQFKLFFFD